MTTFLHSITGRDFISAWIFIVLIITFSGSCEMRVRRKFLSTMLVTTDVIGVMVLKLIAWNKLPLQTWETVATLLVFAAMTVVTLVALLAAKNDVTRYQRVVSTIINIMIAISVMMTVTTATILYKMP